jgi:hypothetical protein
MSILVVNSSLLWILVMREKGVLLLPNPIAFSEPHL